MALGTYAELQASVADYIARSDLTSVIPDFIKLSEAKFNRDLRCMQMETRSTAAVDLTDDEPEFVSLPSDFQTMRRVRLSSVTGKPRLEFLNGAQADEFRYGRSNVTGQPQFFTVLGDELELLPTPDVAYTLEMVYRAYIPALATNSTNWLLTLAPDAYLYGALMEAAPYLQNDERIPVWAAGLANAMNGLNRLSQDQAYGAGPLAIRQTGVAP
jgi:hypothetical protein